MPDVFSKKKRSWIMSRIRSKETKPEVAFRKLLWHRGARYRKNYSRLPGKPDIAFPSKRVVVFIDGCFWHRCPKCYREPANNKQYWKAKINYNVAKDKRINREIRSKGWKVLRFWEHDARIKPQKCAEKVLKLLAASVSAQ